MSTPAIPSPSSTDPKPQAASENDASSTSHSEETPNSIPENPFDSKLTRVLFDAIDQLQSSGASQDIQIPQLVIVGEQSSGKSSLLQALTDIPFPVGTGLCTRFATRIVSKRTGPSTANKFKITIVEPEVSVDGFNYPLDKTYEEYVRVGDNLGADEFKAIMEEVSSGYMGIKQGKGADKKNFATQVLRVELSGPLRSHFSIVDIPGIFENDVKVNLHEVSGVKDMVVQYMRNKGNIVIYVCDTSTDVANQKLPKLAKENVQENRLVGVFTKCDRAEVPDEISSIASSGRHSTLPSCGGWFVVRNRSNADDESFDRIQAEEQLFSQAPWNSIPSNRRGSVMLRKYLGNLLGVRIRENFPTIRSSIEERLAKAQGQMDSLGKPRDTNYNRMQYLKDIVQRFEAVSASAMDKPGLLQEGMRVRAMVNAESEKFAERMRQNGHTHPFEDPDLEPVEVLNQMMAEAADSDEDQFKPGGAGNASFFNPPITPPSSRSSPAISTKRSNNLRPHVIPQSQQPPKMADALFEEIRAQLRAFHTTQLPGLIDPDVMPVLFQRQTEKWNQYAAEYVGAVATFLADAALNILKLVCPPLGGFQVVHDGLYKALKVFWEDAHKKTSEELMTYCQRQREHKLATQNPKFLSDLKALQTIRLIKSMQSLRKDSSANFAAVYDKLHFSIEDNMVKSVHDILKTYYKMELEVFIQHITQNIVENFVSSKNSPLKALCTNWIYTLETSDIEKLTREDEESAAKREHYAATIKRLEHAHEIAIRASEETAYLAK